MKKFFSLLTSLLLVERNLYAAEAGMPQLDPEYWPSQVFWLIIIFLTIYILISKIFIPKIKGSIDMREDKIRKDLEEAKTFREQAELKLKEYNSLMETAKIDVVYNTLDIPLKSKPLTIEPLKPGSDKDVEDGPKSVSRK